MGTEHTPFRTTSAANNLVHHTISMMREYEHKSLDELRLEDYVKHKKGGSARIDNLGDAFGGGGGDDFGGGSDPFGGGGGSDFSGGGGDSWGGGGSGDAFGGGGDDAFGGGGDPFGSGGGDPFSSGGGSGNRRNSRGNNNNNNNNDAFGDGGGDTWGNSGGGDSFGGGDSWGGSGGGDAFGGGGDSWGGGGDSMGGGGDTWGGNDRGSNNNNNNRRRGNNNNNNNNNDSWGDSGGGDSWSSSGSGGGDSWGDSGGGDSWGGSGSGGGDSWGGSGSGGGDSWGGSGGGDSWGGSGGNNNNRKSGNRRNSGGNSGGGGDSWGGSSDFGGSGSGGWDSGSSDSWGGGGSSGGGDSWGSSSGSGDSWGSGGGSGDSWGSGSGSGDSWGSGGDSWGDKKNGKKEAEPAQPTITTMPYGILPKVDLLTSAENVVTEEELKTDKSPSSTLQVAGPITPRNTLLRVPITRTPTQVAPRFRNTPAMTPRLRNLTEGLSSPSLLSSPDIFVNRQQLKVLETSPASAKLIAPPVMPVRKIIVSTPNGGHSNILDERSSLNSTLDTTLNTTLPPLHSQILPSPIRPQHDISAMGSGLSYYDDESSVQSTPLHSRTAPSIHSPPPEIRSVSQLPILTDPEYYCQPSLAQLASFSPDQLSRVVNFEVGRREVGKVIWPGETDVRGLNLQALIHFEMPPSITVYPDGSDKPPQGSGLNKPARITLYQVKPPSSKKKIPKFHKALRKQSNSSYDEATFTWSFDVEHFSRYGLELSDDEDDEDEDEENDSSATASPSSDDHPNQDGSDDSHSSSSEENDHEDSNDSDSDADSDADGDNNLSSSSASSSPSASSAEEEEEEFDYSLAPPLPGRLHFDPQTNLKMKAYQEVLFHDDLALTESTSHSFPSPRDSPPPPPTSDFHLVEDDSLADELPLQIRPFPPSRARSHHLPPAAFDIQIEAQNVISHPIRVNRPSDGLQDILDNAIAPDRMFRSRSFRVGWGPSGYLAVPKFCRTEIFHISSTLSPEKSLDLNPVLPADLLKSHLLHSSFASSSDDVAPTFSVSAVDQNIVDKIAQLTDALSLTTPDDDPLYRERLLQAVQIWQMVDALWGRRHAAMIDSRPFPLHIHSLIDDQTRASYVEETARTMAVSAWLQSTLSSETLQLAQHATSPFSRVFYYLTGRQVELATREALMTQQMRLATLVTQALSFDIRDPLFSQLDYWEAKHQSQFIDAHQLELLQLLSGQVEKVHPRHQGEWSWQRSLGVRSWFGMKPGAHLLPHILQRFDASLARTHIGCPEATTPFPLHVANAPPSSASDETTDEHEELPFDTSYMLLHLYCHRTQALHAVLNPDGHTSCPLDLHLSWHLLTGLMGLGFAVHTLSPRLHEQIAADVAFQLESSGLWHWAVYVLLHCPASPRRDAFIQDLIGRHVTPSRQRNQREQFLVRKLHIPVAWIASAKASAARRHFQDLDALRNLLVASQYQEAHDLMMNNVLPRLLNAPIGDPQVDQERINVIISLLSQLEPHAASILWWPQAGGLILSYLCEFFQSDSVPQPERIIELQKAFLLAGNSPYFRLPSQQLILQRSIEFLDRQGQDLFHIGSISMAQQYLPFYLHPKMPDNQLLSSIAQLATKYSLVFE